MYASACVNQAVRVAPTTGVLTEIIAGVGAQNLIQTHNHRHLTKPAWELVNGPNLYRNRIRSKAWLRNHTGRASMQLVSCLNDGKLDMLGCNVLQLQGAAVCCIPAASDAPQCQVACQQCKMTVTKQACCVPHKNTQPTCFHACHLACQVQSWVC